MKEYFVLFNYYKPTAHLLNPRSVLHSLLMPDLPPSLRGPRGQRVEKRNWCAVAIASFGATRKIEIPQIPWILHFHEHR